MLCALRHGVLTNWGQRNPLRLRNHLCVENHNVKVSEKELNNALFKVLITEWRQLAVSLVSTSDLAQQKKNDRALTNHLTKNRHLNCGMRRKRNRYLHLTAWSFGFLSWAPVCVCVCVYARASACVRAPSVHTFLIVTAGDTTKNSCNCRDNLLTQGTVHCRLPVVSRTYSINLTFRKFILLLSLRERLWSYWHIFSSLISWGLGLKTKPLQPVAVSKRSYSAYVKMLTISSAL